MVRGQASVSLCMASLYHGDKNILRNSLRQMNVIGTIAVVVITSLYYFPFNCSLFPSVNTKLILASIGLQKYPHGLLWCLLSGWFPSWLMIREIIHTPAISYPPGFGWEVHIL